MTTEKKCHSCKRTLNISLFKHSKRTSDGYQVNCISCAAEKALANKARYNSRPDVIQTKQKKLQKREEDERNAHNPDLKRCSLCWQWLSNSDFKPSDRTKDGLQVNCIACAKQRSEYANSRYANDPDYRARRLQYHAERWRNDEEYRRGKLEEQRRPETRLKLNQRQREKYANDEKYRNALKKKNRERARHNQEYREQQANYRRSDRGRKSRRDALRRLRSQETYRNREQAAAREKYASDPREQRRQKRKNLAYLNKKYREDPQFRLSRSISGGMRRSLKKNKNNVHWEELVGYSVQDLSDHLASLFTEGMTFDNYGEWHIDHRIPISWFSFTSVEDSDFKACWALENLQPKWGPDNLKKGNRFAD